MTVMLTAVAQLGLGGTLQQPYVEVSRAMSEATEGPVRGIGAWISGVESLERPGSTLSRLGGF